MTIHFGDSTSQTTAATGGAHVSSAVVAQWGANGNGGTFSSGAWRTRTLNYEISDPDGIVSLSSNQFTLQAGTYVLKYTAPAYEVDDHQVVIYNATDGSYVSGSLGYNAHSWANDATSNEAYGCVRLTISGAKAFELRHQCDTSRSSNGFGRGNGNLGVSPNNKQLFSKVEIFKE
tara:strand:+ start:316 stop:840 length:525 start_codon:yes stop_codon:yes gene_type:complete